MSSDARLVLRDVAADELAGDEVRPDDRLGDQSTGCVGREDRGLARLERVVRRRPVVGDMRPFRECHLISLRVAEDRW